MKTDPAAPLFVVNPMSGGGRTKKRWPALERALARAGFEPDAAFTMYHGHGYGLAAAALEDGRRTIIAVGGDGTLNEIISAVIDAGQSAGVRVGTIPMGTGKDVGKCLGIADPVRAIRAIASGAERRLDVGRVAAHDEFGNPVVRHFLLELSAGWIPEVSKSTPRMLKLLGDTAPYIMTTFAKMLGPMNRDFEVQIDGQQFHGRYNSVSIHNMELWGGDMVAVPGAAPDDGLFDVIRWGPLGRRAVIKAVRDMQAGGTHLGTEGIDHHAARVIELASPKKSYLDADGEPGGYLPARIEILPGILRFLAPE